MAEIRQQENLASSPHARGKAPVKKQKVCKFPGCKVEYMGVGAAKYCDEHRKPEYRKFINMIKREQELKEQTEVEKGEKSNQLIQHEKTIATEDTRVCPCGKAFTIKLYPNVEVYPKFCEEHRNPYRREKLLEELKELNGDDDDFEEEL